MTDLQDAICDRLVAARVSKHWVNGTIHVAALVIDPGFQLTGGSDRDRPMQLARRLGWPHLFCDAFHGANAALRDEDDRRKLAVSVFSAVPTKKYGPLHYKAAREAAAWIAHHIHPIVCSATCPLHERMVVFVEDYRRGRPLEHLDVGEQCPSYAGTGKETVRPSSPPGHHAVVAYRYLVQALRVASPYLHCADASRESARAVAKARGLEAAVGVLLELAKKVGL
jgi:hypothetical protein